MVERMAGIAGVADYGSLTFRQLYLRQRVVLFHQYEQTISLIHAIAASNGAKDAHRKKIRNPYA